MHVQMMHLDDKMSKRHKNSNGRDTHRGALCRGKRFFGPSSIEACGQIAHAHAPTQPHFGLLDFSIVVIVVVVFIGFVCSSTFTSATMLLALACHVEVKGRQSVCVSSQGTDRRLCGRVTGPRSQRMRATAEVRHVRPGVFQAVARHQEAPCVRVVVCFEIERKNSSVEEQQRLMHAQKY